ncbi:MAG: penicillin-binding protein 2 [Wolbachia endosymbiont of Meromenopon meropis]|nr:penicillin-binding protein 2 [Wolbachia endosymbiont of Meromenopon meropis]
MQTLVKNKLHSIYFIIPLLIFYIIIIFRMLYLTFNQITPSENLKKNNIKHKQSDILDRNEVVIAINVPTTSLYIDPTKIKNPENIAIQLCSILDDLKYENLYKALTSKSKFSWIKRHLTPRELLIVKNAGIPGINFFDDVKRIYPHNNLFAHVLGYTDVDGKGIAGIEAYISNQYYHTNNEYNEYIQLSLDTRVQSIVHAELTKAVKKYNALGGVGIILSVKNGEIISIVSLPDFNSNLQNKAKDIQKFNRATLGVYEMGSVIKFFTIAAALDANVTKTDDLYDISNPIIIGKYKIRDFHEFKIPKITVRDIFTKSSNIGVAKIATKLGIKNQIEYFRSMKIFSPLKIEVPEKSMPIVPDKWSESTLITTSYGYGIAITPMHIAQTAAALVNDGIFHNATLLLNKKGTGEQIVAKSTSKEIRKLLRAAVTDGTGKKADIKAYTIGGKTGSAEKVINGKYDKNANIASFLGVLTTLDPRYIILIVIDEPQNQCRTGGAVAAPVARSIMNKIAPILNVLPEM